MNGVFVAGGIRSPSRAAWDTARRETFLLRDVALPLSWDTKVLPPAEVSDADDFELFAMILADPSAPQALARWALGERFDVLPQRPFDWKSIGYDVCDEVGYSGLMNCGRGTLERAALVARWGPLLNAHHLFDDVENANAFRLEVNGHVREHAPFLVHRLYVGTRGRLAR